MRPQISRTSEQVQREEDALLAARPGDVSYDAQTVNLDLLERQLNALQQERLRAELVQSDRPVPGGQPMAFAPPMPLGQRTPSMASGDPYEMYSAHFTPSSHGAGEARILPPVFDGPPPRMAPRPAAPMTQDQLLHL